MLNRNLFVLPFALSLLFSLGWAQEPISLEPGKPIEREIAGGQTHTFQITLAAGQFLRVVVEQKAIDVILALAAPDGRQLVEVNLTGAGGLESLSEEAAASGDYRLTVRAIGLATLAGEYQMRLEVKAATAQDKQRVAAERFLIEANELIRKGSAAQQVVEKSEQALAIFRGVKDRASEGLVLNNLGIASASLSRYEKAVEYFEQALVIRREVKDRAGEAVTLNGLGVAYRNLSRYDKAVEYFEQALVIRREVRDILGEGVTLANLGAAYNDLGRYDKAIEYYERALAIHREVKNQANEGRTLNNLGLAYNDLGRYEKAIEYLEQALAIHREVKNRAGEGLALGNIGIVYNDLGRYEKAIEYYEQALAISREIKNRSGEGLTLSNLGLAHYSLSRYEKAIEYYEQALAISRETKNRRIEGIALENLGEVYDALSRHEKAIEYYEQALAISREIKNRSGEETALLDLGNAWRSLSRADKATDYHEQALQIARELKGRADEASSLNNLMLDWKVRNQPRLAIFFGKQSVNAYQEIRGNIRSLDRESQQSFLKSKEETYRNLADLLIAQGRLPEAEQVINMLKQEEYFEFIRRDQAAAPQADKAQLTPEEQALEKRYREIADQLATLGAERGSLLEKKTRTPEEEQRLAKLETDLVIAGQAFQKFLDQLRSELGSNKEASGQVYQLRESQGLMEDLRELGEGVVALYTLVGENKYRVILTTPDFQKGYEYPINAADLNRKVVEFRSVAQNPKLDPLPLAQELYKILVDPVAKDLKAAKAQTLMWSLDGVLRYVPVAALHDGKQYLVERYRNVVFTPASQSRLKDAPSRNWRALGLGVTKAHGDRIPALPGVAEEMRGIIRDETNPTGALPGMLKLDEQFTQEAMLAGLRARPPVVHVASHFQFQPGNETNSALLLGDGNFLSLAQIKTLPNVFGGVELLTLSACNTATGGSGANGKEVEGFGVLAQRQGAKAVVASLWPVADRSTKVLMQEFYRLREANANTTKSEALRQAQLKLLHGDVAIEPATLAASRQIVHEEDKSTTANKPRFTPDPKRPYAHPYYWAPFILIGNWR